MIFIDLLGNILSRLVDLWLSWFSRHSIPQFFILLKYNSSWFWRLSNKCHAVAIRSLGVLVNRLRRRRVQFPLDYRIQVWKRKRLDFGTQTRKSWPHRFSLPALWSSPPWGSSPLPPPSSRAGASALSTWSPRDHSPSRFPRLPKHSNLISNKIG